MMPDDAATNAVFDPSPHSPCLGICLMDPRTRMCRGCLRTIDEIAAWSALGDDAKAAVCSQLPARRRAWRAQRSALKVPP
jgi:hypothetical protein